MDRRRRHRLRAEAKPVSGHRVQFHPFPCRSPAASNSRGAVRRCGYRHPERSGTAQLQVQRAVLHRTCRSAAVSGSPRRLDFSVPAGHFRGWPAPQRGRPQEPMVTILDTRPRHPEKAHKPDTPVLKKPDWIRVRLPASSPQFAETRSILRQHGLHTVCEEAGCPNIAECWAGRHATMLIMGDTCTRACAFCNVKTGLPGPLDPTEPENVAHAVAKLGLDHIVITSVDRDDLADGGGAHFAATIRAIRALTPNTTVEVLTPDFLRKDGALEAVVEATPDIYNHNLETVPSLYLRIRPGARYFHSLRLLQRVKELAPTMFTKSGIMVGLGETRDEVLQLMDDLRSADVDFLTIGQYLQPTRKHAEVKAFVTPETFKEYERIAYAKGFLMVSASPLTRSSYHAGAAFARLRAARVAQQA